MACLDGRAIAKARRRIRKRAARVRGARSERIGKWVLPLAIMALAIWLWDRICVWNEIPRYILPRPGEVLYTLYADAGLLFGSLLVTLKITFLGLALAVVGGVGLAVLFAQSRTGSRCRSSPSPSSCR